jgi:hypothetical protein
LFVALATVRGQRPSATHRAHKLWRIARRSLLGFAHFVPDDAADNRPADGSHPATAGENGTTDGTGTGADSGVLILPRHPGTTTQAEKHNCGNCT